MIIVEGPDGCGKTTLTENLLKKGVVNKILPSPALVGKGPDGLKYETWRYMRLYSGKPVACDRLLFSEMVYGSLFRGKSAFSSIEYMHILLDIIAERVPVVFCMPKNYHFKDDESDFIKDNIAKIREKYEHFYNGLSEHYSLVHRYDWEQDNLDELIEKLKG